jgi:hypothetical protein
MIFDVARSNGKVLLDKCHAASRSSHARRSSSPRSCLLRRSTRTMMVSGKAAPAGSEVNWRSPSDGSCQTRPLYR